FVANILQSPWWPCATNLDQPRAESFQPPQTTWVHSAQDRRAASTCPPPSESEYRAPRSRAASQSSRHQTVPASSSPPRSPTPFGSHRHSSSLSRSTDSPEHRKSCTVAPERGGPISPRPRGLSAPSEDA